MRVTNPATNPELLDALAKHFIDSGFDLKDLVRTICTSQVYQLGCRAERVQPERQAELLAVLSQAADGRSAARRDRLGDRNEDRLRRRAGRHAGRAIARQRLQLVLPDGLRPAGSDQRLRMRASSEANLAQSLHLLNSREVQGKLSAGSGRAALLAGDKDRSREEKIREIVPARLLARAAGRRSGRRAGAPGKSQGREAGLRRHRLGADQHQGIFVQPLTASMPTLDIDQPAISMPAVPAGRPRTTRRLQRRQGSRFSFPPEFVVIIMGPTALLAQCAPTTAVAPAAVLPTDRSTRQASSHRRQVKREVLLRVRRSRSSCASLSLALAAAPATADEAKPIAIAEIKHDGPVDFEKEILPLLTKNCVACHNTEEGRERAGAGDAADDSQRGRLRARRSWPRRAPRACC